MSAAAIEPPGGDRLAHDHDQSAATPTKSGCNFSCLVGLCQYSTRDWATAASARNQTEA
jgi:hypothetical protein